MTRFDMENQTIQKRIAAALERIAELLEQRLEEEAAAALDAALRDT